LYFYISTFRSVCAVHRVAVFCSSLISWFPLCFWGILRMTFRRFQEPLLLLLSLLFLYYYYYYHHHHHHHCYAGYSQSALDKNWLSILVWIKTERPRRQCLFRVYARCIYTAYCIPDLGARITEQQSSCIHTEHVLIESVASDSCILVGTDVGYLSLPEIAVFCVDFRSGMWGRSNIKKR